MAKPIIVERRWIASSNREWCVGSRRGGSLADAVALASKSIEGDIGGTIKVLPDQTSMQVSNAYKAMGWG